MTAILGISTFYHDSAASIIIDGKIIAAAQEERFTRIKHDSSYPFHAVEFVLKFANLKLSNVDHIVFYEKPFLKFERLLETYVAFAPKGFVQFTKAMPTWLREKLFQKRMIFNSLKEHDENLINENKIFFSEHHLSHTLSTLFYYNNFPYVSVVVDGYGDKYCTSIHHVKSNKEIISFNRILLQLSKIGFKKRNIFHFNKL